MTKPFNPTPRERIAILMADRRERTIADICKATGLSPVACQVHAGKMRRMGLLSSEVVAQHNISVYRMAKSEGESDLTQCPAPA